MNYVWIFQPSPVFGDVSWMVGDIKEEASMGKQARLFMREHLFLSIPLISTNSSNLAITEFPAIQAISTLTNSATSLKKVKKPRLFTREKIFISIPLVLTNSAYSANSVNSTNSANQQSQRFQHFQQFQQSQLTNSVTSPKKKRNKDLYKTTTI